MKLSDIKIALIEQYFTVNSNGVNGEALDNILIAICKNVNVSLTESKIKLIEANSNQSNDPFKAFKRFTEGDSSLLTISDEDGSLFSAVRVGKSIRIANLTTDPIDEKDSDFSSVKSALKQAKQIDEEIIFSITTNFSKM
jgi:hypothetical protein